MAWDPEIYNRYKKERYAPFYDLLDLIDVKPGLQVIDLGCGTGELTRLLAEHLPGSQILGIDSSAEMLKKADEWTGAQVRFICQSIQEGMSLEKKWDLIFSNAALQWIDDHPVLFPQIISRINTGGQIAVQVPSNQDHFTHSTLLELAGISPFKEALHGWRRPTPVLKIADYAQLFFAAGGSGITVFEKVYPHVLKDAESMYEWVSGTAMIPYMERLPESLQEDFKNRYIERVTKAFPGSPVFYGFNRILMSARFE